MDKFSTRPGYIPGRCNSKLKKRPGELCRQYPRKGKTRCKRHGSGDTTKARSMVKDNGKGLREYWQRWRER